MSFRIISLILLFLIITTIVNAQEVLMEVDMSEDTLISDEGPNKKNFYYGTLAYGVLVCTSSAQNELINNSKSFDLSLSGGYKRRICNFYALGFELSYEMLKFDLKQQDGKILPDTVLNDKERMRFNQFGISLYNRFNFGKRGNIIGKYLDIGAFGTWVFRLVHVARNKLDNGNKVRTKTTGLNYYEPFSYGVFARIGINKLSVFGKYRFSHFFKSKFNYPEPPPLTVGIALTISE